MIQPFYSKTYSKGRESKHNDHEVDCVSKEHQHIDVRDGTVLRMDQIVEELFHRKVDLHEAMKKNRQWNEEQTRASALLSDEEGRFWIKWPWFIVPLHKEDFCFEELLS